MDSQFHAEIARVARNPYVADTIERELSARHASVGTAFRELTADATRGHKAIVDAIAAHDSGRAEKIMAAHVALAYRGLTAMLKQKVRAQKERASKHQRASDGRARGAAARYLVHRDSRP